MNATAQFKIVFRATDNWWQIRGGDFDISERYGAEEEAALRFVAEKEGEDFLPDCEEAFAVRIVDLAPEHTAIKPGDFIVSDGIGSDKFFVRKIGC